MKEYLKTFIPKDESSRFRLIASVSFIVLYAFLLTIGFSIIGQEVYTEVLTLTGSMIIGTISSIIIFLCVDNTVGMGRHYYGGKKEISLSLITVIFMIYLFFYFFKDLL